MHQGRYLGQDLKTPSASGAMARATQHTTKPSEDLHSKFSLPPGVLGPLTNTFTKVTFSHLNICFSSILSKIIGLMCQLQFLSSSDKYKTFWKITICNSKLSYIYIYIFGTPCEELPWWLSGKASSCHWRRHGFHPWSRKIPGEGNGNLLQYSCLRNPMDRGAWLDTVHGVPKS